MYFKLNEGWTQSYILDHAANEQAHDSWALSLEIYTLNLNKEKPFPSIHIRQFYFSF